jgi:hypothetical protein
LAATKKRTVADEIPVFRGKITEYYNFVSVKTLLFVSFAVEISLVLKNAMLKGTMTQIIIRK